MRIPAGQLEKFLARRLQGRLPDCPCCTGGVWECDGTVHEYVEHKPEAASKVSLQVHFICSGCGLIRAFDARAAKLLDPSGAP